MKKLISMILALSMVMALAACGGTETTTSTATGSAPASSETATTEPDTAIDPEIVDYYFQKANEVVVNEDSVTFTDDSGREPITIMKNPKNPTVLYGSLTCLWYEAGGELKLAVGGESNTPLYVEQIGRDITLDEGVKVVATSSSGTTWDVETIIAEAPDLIVANVGMKGYSTISGPAEAAGIPVIAIQYDSVQDYLKYFKVFCNINGHPELWDEIAEATANRIIEVVSKVPDVEAPRALAVRVSKEGVLKGQGNDTQTGSMIRELGGINVVETDPENGTTAQVEVSMEEIYALDPDVILVIQLGLEGETKSDLEKITKDDPVWAELRAVKEGNVIFLDKRLFHNKPNKDYQQAYIKMAECLYPDFEF